MQAIRDAILAGAAGPEIAALPLPESYRGAFVLRDEIDMFAGVDSADKDPRKSLHVADVAVPELAPDDASGVVLRVGSLVRNFQPGDKITVHCNYVDDQDPSAHDDSMLAANERIWG